MRNNKTNLILGLMLAASLVLAGCSGGGTAGGGTGGSGGVTGGGGSGSGGSNPPPSTVGDWTWTGGPQGGLNGVNTNGVAATSTWPGSGVNDNVSAVWTDTQGNVWMYGGAGETAYQQTDALWKKVPSDTQWTLVGGTINDTEQNPTQQYACNTYPQFQGVWGTKGVASKSNWPPAFVSSPTYWTDKDGNFWLFGGQICATTNNFVASNALWEYNPTTEEWTWVSGDEGDTRDYTNKQTWGLTWGNPGIYGTKGVPDTANKPGGRDAAVGWADSNGNIWIFGGYGTASAPDTYAYGTSQILYLNDLWEYNPTTGEWTWVSGASDTWEVMPSSNGVYYADYSPVEGVYGTKGVASPNNTPGGRRNTVSWKDSEGRLWIYGGDGVDFNGDLSLDKGDPSNAEIGNLSDVWMFDPSTTEWTWEGGDDTAATTLVSYGTTGQASATNTPGSRTQSTGCEDLNGNLWLYGGSYAAGANSLWTSTTISGSMADLWEFNSQTMIWTWEGGSQSLNGPEPVYGTQGVASSQNNPGGRQYSFCWFDTSGDLRLFGGNGSSKPGLTSGEWGAYFNDLWEYQVH